MTAGSEAEESLRNRDWLPTLLSGRPYQLIGDDAAEPYLLRWFLIPRNPVINIYRQTLTSSGLLNDIRRFDAYKFGEVRPRVVARRTEEAGRSDCDAVVTWLDQTLGAVR